MFAAPRLASAPPRQAVAALSWRKVERPPAANDDTPPELSHAAKLIIGGLVFVVGLHFDASLMPA
jgi:hypothetical protein